MFCCRLAISVAIVRLLPVTIVGSLVDQNAIASSAQLRTSGIMLLSTASVRE